MFTISERDGIRKAIIDFANADPRVTGGAITGSASINQEDDWSDIDLAFGVRNPEDVAPTLQDFTSRMYRELGAIHHLDVHSENWIYRVFLLNNTLQVDLAFAPKKDFGAKGPTFKLLFGRAKDQQQPGSSSASSLIGSAWLYALHARSSIQRNKPWQGEHMISYMRDEVLKMACLRHDLPTSHGRGYDALPDDLKKKFEPTVVATLSSADMRRAFANLADLLIEEIRFSDSQLADKLSPTLLELARMV